jgi:biotin operon repressor
MPRRRKEEIAKRARSVFDDFDDTELSTPEIATKHGISVAQVRKDVAWWWAHHEEFELPKARAPKKKREQCYDELWDWDAEDFARVLNRFGARWVQEQMECSRTTVWRATMAKGLRRGEDGKYVVQPPSPDDPDYLKMLAASPRRGPAALVVGDGQQIFGGRRTRQNALSLWCPHEFEKLELPDPLGLRGPEVKYRCRHCGGIEHRG